MDPIGLPSVSRRDVLLAAGAVAVFPTLASSQTPVMASDLAASAPRPWPHFPHHDPALIAELVGKAHVDEAAVRLLVGHHPELVNAWWDWGFGDWESALGAASHTGRRSIAEFLIDRGARIDLFAAAMLGMTDVVRAFVSARPGVQRQLGPHGFTLLAHARAGGAHAKDTVEYLHSLGDADQPPATITPSPEDRDRCLGEYTLSPDVHDRFSVKLNQKSVMVFAKTGETDRVLHATARDRYFPAGVPTTSFVFAPEAGTLTITAGVLEVVAKRVSP